MKRLERVPCKKARGKTEVATEKKYLQKFVENRFKKLVFEKSIFNKKVLLKNYQTKKELFKKISTQKLLKRNVLQKVLEKIFRETTLTRKKTW